MLSDIGMQGYETAPTPNPNAAAVIQALLAAGNPAPVVAEFGVGVGATSLAMASSLDNRGELHLYDCAETVVELAGDLARRGFTNVKGFGNSSRHWDSYNWSLGKRLLAGERAIYDYIYIDGAHTFAVDGLAFVLADRLLRPGGYLEFDDYGWSFARSCWMQDTRQHFMTEEQIRTPQVKMVIDLFLRGNPDYRPVQENRLYRKCGGNRANRSDDAASRTETVNWRGQRFQVVRHPAVSAALRDFRSPLQVGALQFFDAVLPDCTRMIDLGAHVGLISLYAADRVDQVFSFEPNPSKFALLMQNVAANTCVQARFRLFRCGLSDAEGSAVLYRRAANGDGAGLVGTVERGEPVSSASETIALRDARDALHEIGLNEGTLLQIDIGAAMYRVLPRIADLLAATRPYLHVSLQRLNPAGNDRDHADLLLRQRGALQVAKALAGYAYMYCHTEGQWQCIETADHMPFLHECLLRLKPAPRASTGQCSCIDAIGFSDRRLPALEANTVKPSEASYAARQARVDALPPRHDQA